MVPTYHFPEGKAQNGRRWFRQVPATGGHHRHGLRPGLLRVSSPSSWPVLRWARGLVALTRKPGVIHLRCPSGGLKGISFRESSTNKWACRFFGRITPQRGLSKITVAVWDLGPCPLLRPQIGLGSGLAFLLDSAGSSSDQIELVMFQRSALTGGAGCFGDIFIDLSWFGFVLRMDVSDYSCSAIWIFLPNLNQKKKKTITDRQLWLMAGLTPTSSGLPAMRRGRLTPGALWMSIHVDMPIYKDVSVFVCLNRCEIFTWRFELLAWGF